MGLLQRFNYNNKSPILAASRWHTAAAGFTGGQVHRGGGSSTASLCSSFGGAAGMQEGLSTIRQGQWFHHLVLAREGMRRVRAAVVFSPPRVGVPLLPLGSPQGCGDDGFTFVVVGTPSSFSWLSPVASSSTFVGSAGHAVRGELAG